MAAACSKLAFPFAFGLAIMQKESGGRNVYGNDTGGALAGQGEVTEANYQEFRRLVLTELYKSNGVGPMQVTYRGYFPTMEGRGLRPWVPADNILFGVEILHFRYQQGVKAGKPPRDAFWESARAYNAGSRGGETYADDAVAKARAWLAIVGNTDQPTVTL